MLYTIVLFGKTHKVTYKAFLSFLVVALTLCTMAVVGMFNFGLVFLGSGWWTLFGLVCLTLTITISGTDYSLITFVTVKKYISFTAYYVGLIWFVVMLFV